ncbi:MAG: hypothetical protein IPM63_17995 [Acidobacteriota bacterium]|nr:MAG: hypothetical protein IPM63_17995 [Acidobacteriota bacterium]
MTLPLSHTELLRAVETQSMIGGGIPDRIEGNRYYFRIALAFLHSPNRQIYEPIDSAALRQGWTLEPSETVFVVSNERLSVPQDIRVIVTPSREIQDIGLRLLGERRIEEHFNGRLLLGIFNNSGGAFEIDAGLRYATGTFEHLEGNDLSSAFSN